MKKTYISPSFMTVTLNLRSHLLVDSAGTQSVTVNIDDEITGTTNFAKEINIWDEEW